MRYNAAASDVNKELNTSEFSNASMEEEEPAEGRMKVEKTQIGDRMSKILADFDNDDSEEEIKMKGRGLVMQLTR
jgi:hypothetical protein